MEKIVGERFAYFIGYIFAVFVQCSIHFKDVYFFWIFPSQMPYSVPGLIYKCIAVERACEFFPIFLLVDFGSTFEFYSYVFPLGEVALAVFFFLDIS